MLGWMIYLRRQANGGALPGKPEDAVAGSVASWTASFAGLRWIDLLVREGRATDLGGGGYPQWFTLQAKDLVPMLMPALALEYARIEEMDADAMGSLDPDEWLLLEAWDKS